MDNHISDEVEFQPSAELAVLERLEKITIYTYTGEMLWQLGAGGFFFIFSGSFSFSQG